MKIEQIKRIYDAIMNDDVIKAQEIVESISITKNSILKLIRSYNTEVGNESFTEKYNKFLHSYSKYFMNSMDFIKEYQETGKVTFSEYDLIPSVIRDLKRVSTNFPFYSEIINKIIEEMELLKSELAPCFLEKEYEYSTRYEEEFHLIATSENAIDVYRNLNWTEKEFYQKLEHFKNAYKTKKDRELADTFEKQYKEYLKKYRTTQEILVDLQYRSDRYSLSQSIVNDLVVSGLSIYEYCHINPEYNILDIKNAIKMVYGENEAGRKNSEEFINKINDREKPQFRELLKYIASEIMSNPNFTIIDYYLYTKLSLEDFYQIVDNHNVLVAQFVTKNSTNTKGITRGYKQALFRIEDELRMTRIIKGRLITEEEKNKIFKYLEINKIPINQYTYRACINKLIDNDLEFVQKIKCL